MDFLIGFIQGSVAVAIGYVAGWFAGKDYGIKRAISEAVICSGKVEVDTPKRLDVNPGNKMTDENNLIGNYKGTAKVLSETASELYQISKIANHNLLNADSYIKSLEGYEHPNLDIVCAHCGKSLHDLILDVALLNSATKTLDSSLESNHGFSHVGINPKDKLPTLEIETSWDNWKLPEMEEHCLEHIKCPHCKRFPFTNTHVNLKQQTIILLRPNVKDNHQQ